MRAYPRSNGYDPVWILDNLMGPNVLWLTEALTKVINLKAGMRVLDLGCGKAISSIFLAKEFDVSVWAADLWIPATENWERIKEANVEAKVFPIHAEAHDLPFAHGYFDVILSMDAYHYFGTADLYLNYLAPFLKEGGQLGVVVPGLVNELEELPKHLEPHWPSDFWSFHSPQWWQRHWERSGHLKVEHADTVPNGWKDWLTWLDVCEAYDYPTDPESMAMLKADKGSNLGFTRVVARKL